jgi:hypothetical protein
MFGRLFFIYKSFLVKYGVAFMHAIKFTWISSIHDNAIPA